MSAVVGAYAGPGGWAEGIRMLGLSEVGIELDPAACATRTAAGHQAIRADVAAFPLDHLVGRVEGLIAGPPCQSFSAAGKGEGRKVLDRLVGAVHRGDWHAVDPTRAAGYGHVLEVGRWAETLLPEWVVCEQVPEVLPVWQAYAHRWRGLGYSTWAGVLCAADYGVPQTRRRAFLLASRVRSVAPPAPTHAEHPQAALFGPALARWVSMADALGWAADVEVHHIRGAGMVERHGPRPGRRACQPSPTIEGGAYRRLAVRNRPLCDECGCPEDVHDADGFCAGPCGGNCTDGGRRPRHDDIVLTERQSRGATRSVNEPAMTITASADNGNYRWVLNRRQNSRTSNGGSEPVRLVPISEPAPTLTGIAGAKGQWLWQRPATTIVGDARVFGPHSGSAGEPQSSNSVALTLPEALTLQGFDPDYPVQGNKSERFQQVGNACPPPLAAHVIAAVTGRALELEEAA